jgi:hypothetical protein
MSKVEKQLRDLVVSSYYDIIRRGFDGILPSRLLTLEIDHRLSKMCVQGNIYNYKFVVSDDLEVEIIIQRTRLPQLDTYKIIELSREKKIDRLLNDI